MYSVQDFFNQHGKSLDLRLISEKADMKRSIGLSEVQSPGLGLAGHLRFFSSEKIFVFGKEEISFLKQMDKKVHKTRLREVLTTKTPAVIVSTNLAPSKELLQACELVQIPLFCSSLSSSDLQLKASFILNEELAPRMSCHGTLMEVHGEGVLIQGDSSSGKSEAALGLIEKGHRLIADDIVQITLRNGSSIEGSGSELTRHLLEIRGIGVINVAHLYGASSVSDAKTLDLVVKLEIWNDKHFYDRMGLEEKFCEILGVALPYHLLPVKPGRDIALLLEVLALNHRLKKMGYHCAKELRDKLAKVISQKKTKEKKVREINKNN